MEMRSKDCSVPVVRGAGVPGGEGEEPVRSTISSDPAPFKILVSEGACRAIFISAAGASAEPVRPTEDAAKAEAKAVSTAGKMVSRSGRQSAVVIEAETRAIKLSEGADSSSALRRNPCLRKMRKPRRSEREPTQNGTIGAGRTNPPKPTTGTGEERVRSLQARIMQKSASSRRVSYLDLLRSCFVADCGERDRNPALPLPPP